MVRSHRSSGLISHQLGFQKDVRKVQESTGGEKIKLKVGKKLWDSAGSRPRFWESGGSGKDYLFPSPCSAHHLSGGAQHTVPAWVQSAGPDHSSTGLYSVEIKTSQDIQGKGKMDAGKQKAIQWSLTFCRLETEMISLK